eukprot:3651111-Rhodomonas_salina.1
MSTTCIHPHARRWSACVGAAIEKSAAKEAARGQNARALLREVIAAVLAEKGSGFRGWGVFASSLSPSSCKMASRSGDIGVPVVVGGAGVVVVCAVLGFGTASWAALTAERA